MMGKKGVGELWWGVTDGEEGGWGVKFLGGYFGGILKNKGGRWNLKERENEKNSLQTNGLDTVLV